MGWTAGATNAFLALPGADELSTTEGNSLATSTPQPKSATPNGFAALAVYDDPKNGGNGEALLIQKTPCSLPCGYGPTQP